MKFKLTKLHLFLILLAVLIFSSMGIKILEGMTSGERTARLSGNYDPDMDSDDPLGEEVGVDDNLNSVSDGSDYDPNNNAGGNELSNMFSEENKRASQEEGGVEGDFDDTTFQPDLRVNFQNTNPSKTKLSYGAKGGITKDQIPPGQEHLYVLKSQIVPPVCPKCPESKGGGGNGKGGMKGGQCCPECPPCPAPQRCPEPAFTCKKVPNYSASNVDSVLPGGMGGGGMGGGGMGGGGMMGGESRDKQNGILDGSGAGAGNGGGAAPVLNSFANFS